jgi:hypothetical protein
MVESHNRPSNSHLGRNCSRWMTIQRRVRRILIRLEPQSSQIENCRNRLTLTSTGCHLSCQSDDIAALTAPGFGATILFVVVNMLSGEKNERL